MAETYGEIRGALVKLPVGAGVDLGILDRYLNDRLQQIARAHKWTRLKADTTLQTIALYEEGTVAVTNGLNTLTLTGGTWTSGMTGREIRLQEDNPIYVFTFATASTGTLDRVYEGETATAAAYKIFKRIYALPSDCGSLTSIKIPFSDRELDQTELENLDFLDPSRQRYGRPETFTPVKDSSDTPGVPQTELYPIPEEAEGYPASYQKKIARITAGATYIPDWISAECLVAGATADLHALAKDFQGAAYHEGRFNALLEQMKSEDNRRRVPQQLRMADRFVTHRASRAIGRNLDAEDKRRRMP